MIVAAWAGRAVAQRVPGRWPDGGSGPETEARLMIDLERHGRLLRRFVRDGNGRIVPACMKRMADGRVTYERPGFADERDLLAEANDRLLDAINYTAIWAAERNGAVEDPIVTRYFRHLQSAHALLQVMRAREDKVQP